MTFSIKKSFKESWSIFTSKNFYFPFILTSFVGIIGLYFVFGLSGFLSIALLGRGLWWVLIPIIIALLFVGVYFILVNINLSLAAYKTKEVHFKKAFSSVWNFKLITKTAGLLLLIGGGVLIVGYLASILLSKIHPILAVVVFIVWVAYIAVQFAFSLYILVDSKETIINSMKKSYKMIQGHGWRFLLFIICVSIISAVIQIIISRLGFFSPIVSDVVSILFGIALAPWFSLLTVSPYIQLKSHS